MEIAKTPDCNFGEKPKDFKLKGVDNKIYTLNDFKDRFGTLVMFICNHCPYVNAFIKEIVEDVEYFRTEGIKSVAIMSNDTKNYPEDSFENMILFQRNTNLIFHIYLMKPKKLPNLTVPSVHQIFLVMEIGNMTDYNTEVE